jgi:hypothetical protein
MGYMLQSDLLAMGRNAQKKIRDFGYKPFLIALEKLLN